MKKTTMKNFGGLTYLTVINIPVRETEVGDVIDLMPGKSSCVGGFGSSD